MNFHFNQNCPVVDHASTVCGCAGCHSCPVPMLRAWPAGVRAHHTTGATPRGLFRQLPPPARDPTRPHSTPDSGTEGASHRERRGIKELSQSDEALCRVSQPRVARYGALILRAGRGGWHWRALGRGHRSFVWKRFDLVAPSDFLVAFKKKAAAARGAAVAQLARRGPMSRPHGRMGRQQRG